MRAPGSFITNHALALNEFVEKDTSAPIMADYAAKLTTTDNPSKSKRES
jgi:hypothetical protein